MKSFSFFLTYWYVLSHKSDALEWKRLFVAGWNSSHFFKNYSKVMKKETRKTQELEIFSAKNVVVENVSLQKQRKTFLCIIKTWTSPRLGYWLGSVLDKLLLLSAIGTQISLRWSWYSCPSSPCLLQVLVLWVSACASLTLQLAVFPALCLGGWAAEICFCLRASISDTAACFFLLLRAVPYECQTPFRCF